MIMEETDFLLSVPHANIVALDLFELRQAIVNGVSNTVGKKADVLCVH